MKKILIAGLKKDTENYVDILKFLGADTEVTLEPASLYAYDGLVLPGGGDICPSFFDQRDTASRKVDPNLDRKQFSILYRFILTNKPVLGICKGMQLLNVFYGGDLIQQLTRNELHDWNGADQWHETTAEKNSILQKLYTDRFYVNSAHHQCVGRVGYDLKPIQYSGDGVVEAISHERLPLLGVQWHPERMCLGHKKYGTIDGTAVFKWLLA